MVKMNSYYTDHQYGPVSPVATHPYQRKQHPDNGSYYHSPNHKQQQQQGYYENNNTGYNAYKPCEVVSKQQQQTECHDNKSYTTLQECCYDNYSAYQSHVENVTECWRIRYFMFSLLLAVQDCILED